MNATSSDASLLVGLDTPDDAAVYRLTPEIALVQTVDFFTPIVDDARAWGRIAAANALSDVYAMGGRPLTALNLVAWPRTLDMGLLGEVLEGADEACAEAGARIVGGHSIDDPEPKYGLAVTGTVHPDRIVRKLGAMPGDELVLTKPLGMGIISSAVKEERATAAAVDEAISIMSRLNAGACSAMLETGVSAATDVTGFGLIGHLAQMLDDQLSAELRWGTIPRLEEAVELARAGILPGGSRRNREAMSARVKLHDLSEAEGAVLFDAQTSGGLLIAVSSERAPTLLEALAKKSVNGAARIGRLVPGDGSIEVRR